MERLFAYGTLRDGEVHKRLLGRELAGISDFLSKYQISGISIEGEQYPIAEPDDGEKIEGIVYEVNLEELKKIDEYEGPEYKREEVMLDSKLRAWVYTKADGK
jgi:gamma-glutamylcyclotransferase (GGCT)/AIG2-like uncharacterized protein YtfP